VKNRFQNLPFKFQLAALHGGRANPKEAAAIMKSLLDP
jgi:hypothetical protein